MPTYAYTARDASGKQVNGTVEATGQREVTAILADQALFPVNVTEADDAAGNRYFGNRKRKVKGQTMAIFYSQLASLLRAGVPMIRSLNVLSLQSTEPVLKQVIGEVRDRVEDGEPLGDSMSRYPGVFSEMACNMVRAGTEGGFLEDALDRVGAFTELQEDLKGRTISALAYPVFLFSVGSVVLSALLVFLRASVRHAVRPIAPRRGNASCHRRIAGAEQLSAVLWMDHLVFDRIGTCRRTNPIADGSR